MRLTSNQIKAEQALREMLDMMENNSDIWVWLPTDLKNKFIKKLKELKENTDILLKKKTLLFWQYDICEAVELHKRNKMSTEELYSKLYFISDEIVKTITDDLDFLIIKQKENNEQQISGL